MPIRKIGSPDPKYLSATDILISDMSNITYDFLLFNRPIILIANKWLRKNFPDLGIKTTLDGLEEAIERCMKNPGEFEKNRKYWLGKTMYRPDGKSTDRVINTIIKKSGIKNPFFLLIHADNEVSKVHLDPIFEVLKKRNMDVKFIAGFTNKNKYLPLKNRLICVATHNQVLFDVDYGYKVHINHNVKGAGTTDIEKELEIFKMWNHCPNTNLHITEGEISHWKTRKFLGPYSDRAVMAGYPKADALLKLNTRGNKKAVCKQLNFDSEKPLITYAPTGKYSYPFKQGASLSNQVLDRLKKISMENDYNILIKLRGNVSVAKKIIGGFKKIISN